MANVGFKIKKRPPKAEVLIRHVTNELEKVADDIGEQSISQRGRVIDKWAGAAPSWIHTVNTGNAIVKLRVYMTGDEFGMKKWKWLDQGTKVRHAVMSRKPRFIAKTRPRIISSRAGQGFKAFVSRKISMPGIDKREFDLTVNTRMTKRAKGRVDTVVKRALKRKRF